MTDPNVPAPAAPAGAPAPSGDYPGKTLGIVGLILVFVVTVVGLIVSAVALSQSKKAGFKNTPAKVGVILGIVFIALGVIFTVLWFAVFATTFSAATISSF
ncbi:MAG TPA: hypothetical protein VKY66_02900 [Protaetiibacter sp.]|nr:hypothetical protein [Protaetiibacter sp.]